MKKFLFLLSMFTSAFIFAQAPPQGINYQAVARDASGAELQNTPLTVRIGIYTDAAATVMAYEETHAVTTNAFGLFNAVIGQGTQTSASAFNAILWANSAHYLKVEINGGSGFTDMGTTQLMSVPYALYAGSSAGGPTGPQGATGAQGPIGPTGAQGIAGATGAQGNAGLQGATGANGINGSTGATGATGSGIHCWDLNGDNNNDLSEDVNGDGSWNSLDCIGATGAQGIAGANGVTGATGTNGIDGINCWDTNGNNITDPSEDINLDGFWNSLDCQGPTGATGAAGNVGATGPAGPSGTNGTNGTNGTTGPTGPSGAIGSAGPTGPSGINGTNGVTGPSGPSGAIGTAGPTGPNGAAGATGANGTNGATGATGATGPTWTITTSTFNSTGTLSLTTTIPSTVTSTNGAWLTTGNGGMSATTNYIGTSDLNPLVFRTGGIERMRIDGSNGNLGIGVTPGIYKLDVNGTGRFTNPLTIGAYTLPNTDGAANGYVLKTNAAGTVTWQPDNNSGGTITGGGTTNFLTKWTSATALGNSLLQENGTEMSMNGTPVSGISMLVYNTAIGGTALYGQNNSSTGTAVRGTNLTNGTGVFASANGTGNALWAEQQSTGTAAFINHTGVSGTGLKVTTAGATAATFTGGNVSVGPAGPAVIPGATRYLSVSSTNAYTTDMAAFELVGSGASATDVIGRIDFIKSLNGPSYTTLQRIGGTSGGDLLFSTYGTSLVERMRITSNGNVGVGTVNPQSIFEVATDGSLINGMRVSNSNSLQYGPTIYFDAQNNDWTMSATNAAASVGANKLTFRNYSGALDVMTLEPNGEVGIGTGSPATTLDIYAAENSGIDITSPANAKMRSSVNSVSGGQFGMVTNHDLHFFTNNTNRFAISGAGSIGIGGTYNASYRTIIYGANEALATDNSGIIIGDIMGNSFGQYFSIPFENNSNFLMMGGNLGIGLTPTQRLEVSGNVQIPAANNYQYAAAKTLYYSVPSAAFRLENTSVCDLAMISGNVYTTGGNPVTVAYLNAPVNLPQGATVTSVVFYVVDNDGTYNLQAGQLFRNDASTSTSYGNIVTMASTPLPASTNSTLIQATTTNTISSPVIDNQNYTYYLRWGTQQANANMRLVKVLITYTVTKAD